MCVAAGIEPMPDDYSPAVPSIPEGVVPQLLRCGLSAGEIVNNIRLCRSGGIKEPRDGIALAVWALLINPEALAVCSAA